MRTLGGYFLGAAVAVYNKPALSVADQITLLEQRGMAIPDHGEAAFYLTHISYYRLRAYWLTFEDLTAAPNHQFKPGTSFKNALDLYVFDRELRLLVLDAIERVEISFRTAFTHVLGMTYGPHAHMNPAAFDRKFYPACLTGLQEEISRSREDFIKHYAQKYSDPRMPPIWAVSEVMSLGLLSKWFNAVVRRQDRKAIAASWGVDEVFVVSFLRHLANVRNFCAHHSRLWNRQFAVTMQLPQGHAKLAAMMNPASPRRLHNALATLSWLLNQISPHQSWTTRLVQHIKGTPLVRPTDMGFTTDWDTKAPWV